MFWQDIYSKYPWSGQEEAMSQGGIKPHFAQSTLSFHVARILLLVVAIVVGFLNWRTFVLAGFAFWAGAASIPVLIVATDADAYHGQFGFLAVVFLALLYGFFIFWPALCGILSGAALGALFNRYSSAASEASHALEPAAGPVSNGESSPPAQ